jgi:hypothetical protein
MEQEEEGQQQYWREIETTPTIVIKLIFIIFLKIKLSNQQNHV